MPIPHGKKVFILSGKKTSMVSRVVVKKKPKVHGVRKEVKKYSMKFGS